MTRLLPSTIFGRLAASLLLVLGAALIVMLALVMRDRRELSIRVGSVGDSAHRIEFLTREYQMRAPADRVAYLARLEQEPSILMEPESYPGRRLTAGEIAEIQRAFVAEIHDRLGDGYRVKIDRIGESGQNIIHLVTRRREEHGTTALDLTLVIPGGDTLIYRVAVPPLDPPLPWRLLAQLGALTWRSSACCLLVTRGITRPLSKLAVAAEGMGRNVGIRRCRKRA